MAALRRAGLLRPWQKAHLEAVVIAPLAERGEADMNSGIGTVDIETAKMLVGAVLVVAIGAFSVLTVGGMVRAMAADLRAGRAELRGERVSEPR